MALLEVIEAPDPRLKIVCDPVDTVGDDLRRLMDDMLETMYAAPGIGLSAPQVGDRRRVIVVDVAREGEERRPLRMVNPEIAETGGAPVVSEEGCLSFPELFAEVERPSVITVRYVDENSKTHEIEAEGLLATCVQHEVDHLDGILFVDYISVVRRNMILRKMKKTKRLKARDAA